MVQHVLGFKIAVKRQHSTKYCIFMIGRFRVFIYGLIADDGKKFKIDFPAKYFKKTVQDLKLYVLDKESIAVDCQTLFVCKDGGRLELLNDESVIFASEQEAKASTLHLYIKKSAQLERLEKTRQSDFDAWLVKLKELNISPYYKGTH